MGRVAESVDMTQNIHVFKYLFRHVYRRGPRTVYFNFDGLVRLDRLASGPILRGWHVGDTRI